MWSPRGLLHHVAPPADHGEDHAGTRANTPGPVQAKQAGPGTPALVSEHIQMIKPTAKMKAKVAPTAGHGLGLTRW